jgi:hypothetical protein
VPSLCYIYIYHDPYHLTVDCNERLAAEAAQSPGRLPRGGIRRRKSGGEGDGSTVRHLHMISARSYVHDHQKERGGGWGKGRGREALCKSIVPVLRTRRAALVEGLVKRPHIPACPSLPLPPPSLCREAASARTTLGITSGGVNAHARQ